MIDKKLAGDILSLALEKGADFGEIFVEKSRKNSISLVNGKVDRALSGTDFGLGLRIISGDKVIYSYTNIMEKDHLMKMTAESCAAIEENKTSGPFVFTPVNIPSAHIVKIPSEKVSKSVTVQMLKSAHSAASGYSSLITQTSMGYTDKKRDILIANTNGLWTEDSISRTRLAINAVASQNGVKQTGYFGPGALMGFEFMENTDIDLLAREAAVSAVTMLKAKDCPSGKMPVVMDNGFGGVIFHEACGHGLEASAVSKNASVFAGKLGEQIASPKVTAVDDGTIKNSWGSVNIDDEGTPATKNVLIENGILKNYMADNYTGKKIGISSTGACRRESYKHIPTYRMTNTYIACGSDSREDIISSVDYGIYAKHMGGGSVNPTTGEFNFAVNEAYIIRNGKIAEPVRGATLIGKGAEVLMDIDMVSDDLKLAEGMCGASSGSIPVCVGQPMLRVREMTVGGKV